MSRACAMFLIAIAFVQPLVAQPKSLRELLSSTDAHRDVEYAKVGDKSLRLDVYVPKEAKGALPCVVWIHGGAWRGGSKNDPQVAFLLEHGYVVASIQYRFSGEAKFPAQLHDCKGAVRFLRAHAAKYRIDPKRIAAAGASAGGHLASLLGTTGDVKELEGDVGGNGDQSSRVGAVLDLFGPTDFLLMNKQAGDGRIDHDAADSPESQLIGGPIQENTDKAARANPVTYITKDDPPFLILHGDKDTTVPHAQSELLAAALEKSGVAATLYTMPNVGHAWRPDKMGDMVRKFFDKALKDEKPR